MNLTDMPSGFSAGAILVAILLAYAAVMFFARFVWPALRLGRELERVLRQMESLPRRPGQAIDLDAIGRDIMGRAPLAHLWREYRQTLHGITETAGDGQTRIVAWRATAMAETFFTEQALVDVPLRTDFYKHLPGILTGLGIIGTFAGLITGLTHFEVSSNAETVRSSLRELIQGVGHAFKVSAAAIALAMLFTWIEKALVTARYRQVARLVQRIDSLFDSGVGEEYLSRLVRASETSASQSIELGRMIVRELRQALEDMSQRQQQAFAQQQSQLSTAVSQAVAQVLNEPMGRVALAIERTGSGQGEVMGRALEDALTRFSERLNQTFGQHQSGLESLLAQTAQTLQQAVAELRRVAAQLENAGRGTVETAASRLHSAGAGIDKASVTFACATEDMLNAANALTSAANAAGEIMRDHRSARETFAQMLADLRDTVSLSRREAALTGELVSHLETAATNLSHAERQAETYLRGVSDVLTQAHAAFARNVENTLHQGNTQFQRELATAIDYLRGAIEELGETLETAAGKQ